MFTNMLSRAAKLCDDELLRRLDALARTDRQTTVEMLAHLAALEDRPSAFAARGLGSLYAYCTEGLRLSEDAACNRIRAARACRRFPIALEMIAAGDLTVTAARLLEPVLTPENHASVLARARRRTRREVELLVVELAPRPDAVSMVRRLPVRTAAPLPHTEHRPAAGAPISAADGPPEPREAGAPGQPGAIGEAGPVTAAPLVLPPPPPVIRPSAPERYRVQFTIDHETHDKLRRLQGLLRREVPSGDPGILFGRAISLLLETVERKKRAKVARPKPRPVTRPGTGKPGKRSRHVPAPVVRAASARDGERCAFRAPDGRRCTERAFLELHHRDPFARGGPASSDNITLYCRTHNQFEAERAFGPWASQQARAARPPNP